MESADKITLVYDGHCRLCSWGVAWVVARVPADKIRFLPCQSDEGARLMAEAGIDALAPQTILVRHDGLTYIKGKAIVYLLKTCGGISALLAQLLLLLPARWVDAGYAWIAARRYRLFGQLNACFIPAAEPNQKQ